MSEVKRYYVSDETNKLSTAPTKHGWHRIFVLASDYDALKAQNAELVELLRACSPHAHLVASRNPKLELPRALCNAIDAVLARTTKEPA